MKMTTLVAKTIPEAWFFCIDAAYEHGYDYEVESGSYKGQKRKELDYVTVHIEYPGVRPLVPDIPPAYDIPPPTTQDYVDEYFPKYLMSDIKEKEEQYTYGERLLISMEKVIQRYVDYGYGNNQLIMQVGQPSDIDLDDPPCLRHVDTRVRYGQLHFIIYFRSWDLWGGFPANLAGLQLVKEYMVDQINSRVAETDRIKDGSMIVSSKGLHLYGYAWELAERRLGKFKVS